MHERNQPILLQPFIAVFQWLLLSTPLGRMLVQVSDKRSTRHTCTGSRLL